MMGVIQFSFQLKADEILLQAINRHIRAIGASRGAGRSFGFGYERRGRRGRAEGAGVIALGGFVVPPRAPRGGGPPLAKRRRGRRGGVCR